VEDFNRIEMLHCSGCIIIKALLLKTREQKRRIMQSKIKNRVEEIIFHLKVHHKRR